MAIMTSRQAAELDHAFERNGWTAEDVKDASGGDLLASLLLVVRKQAKVLKSILTLLRTLLIPAQPAITTSKEYFKEAGVVLMGNNFKAQFLGLEVGATEVSELAVRKLEEASLDAPIITELGDKAKLAVSQFRAFLAENRKSSEWFIFYLIGRDGNLWAVYAYWSSGCGGWFVDAYSVDSPSRWNTGYQVVSRN